MIIKAYNENHKYLLFIDLEFSNQELVQFAGLLFNRIEDDTYQLSGSINVYISRKVCYPFMEYTNITNNFLEENGIPIADARALIMEDFLDGIPLNEIEVISHGLKNDRIVLNEAGINLSSANGKPIDGYCTYMNARRILARPNHLTLNDIAEEAGYYLHSAHNAYNDVWAEVSVFTYLKKIEQQKGEEYAFYRFK